MHKSKVFKYPQKLKFQNGGEFSFSEFVPTQITIHRGVDTQGFGFPGLSSHLILCSFSPYFPAKVHGCGVPGCSGVADHSCAPPADTLMSFETHCSREKKSHEVIPRFW